MNESNLRKTLLLHAFESQAPDDVWPERDRARVSQAALEAISADPAKSVPEAVSQPQNQAFIAARAQAAEADLLERDPQAAQAYQALRWRKWVPPLILFGALLLGIASDVIGNQRQINLLAPPLIGLLVWHAALYLGMAGAALVPMLRSGQAHTGWLRRAVSSLALSAGAAQRLTGRARQFATRWLNASAPLTSARTATTLHLGAVLLAGGAVAAMYARGLAFEYTAGWESTFLNAPQVAGLLHTLLSPASMLTGIALPSATEIEALAFANGAGENAARWIHLWAATITLFVLLPRLAMALVAGQRARRLREDLPHDFAQPYYEGLGRLLTGQAAGLLVVPYAIRPDANATQALQTSFRRLYGSRADVTMRATVAFGDEDDYEPEPADQQAELVAVLFSLSATPERENQGEFIRAVAAGCGPNTRLLVLVDEQAFRQRFAGNPERLEQRQSAWQQLVASFGLQAVFVRLDPAQIEHNVSVLQASLATHGDSARFTQSAAPALR
mgnify:FL=1